MGPGFVGQRCGSGVCSLSSSPLAVWSSMRQSTINHHRPLTTSTTCLRIRLKGPTSTLPGKGRQPRVLRRSASRDVRSGICRNAGYLGRSECFARSQHLLWSAERCLETLLVWRTWTKRRPRHDPRSFRTPDSKLLMLTISRRLCSTSRTTWPVETRMRCQNAAARRVPFGSHWQSAARCPHCAW